MIEPYLYRATGRRDFLAWCLSGIILHTLGCAGSDDPTAPVDVPGTPLNLDQVLRSYFESDDLGLVGVVGDVYGARFHGDGRKLSADLAIAVNSIASEDDVSTAVGVLRSLVAADFADGQVVHVDGWQLSVTEARLAALVKKVTTPAHDEDVTLDGWPDDMRQSIREAP